MKETLFVTSIIGERPEVVDFASNDAARKAFEDVVAGKMLDRARENAPGGMAEQINAGPLEITAKGEYRMNIYAPKRYLSVEQGSGLYGPDGQMIHIEPTKFKALATADGQVLASVESPGQPAQRPIGRAFDEFKHELVGAYFKEVRSDLAGFVASRRRR